MKILNEILNHHYDRKSYGDYMMTCKENNSLFFSETRRYRNSNILLPRNWLRNNSAWQQLHTIRKHSIKISLTHHQIFHQPITIYCFHLQLLLKNNTFDIREIAFQEFLHAKITKFYKNMLESRWGKIIKANSLYFDRVKITVSKIHWFSPDQQNISLTIFYL